MSNRQLVIVGGGFAGVWAAMGAAAMLAREGGRERVSVTLVSPDEALVIRPRLYESDLSGVRVPLASLLPALGVDHLRAAVTAIDVERRVLVLDGGEGGERPYDQLVLCAGSRLELPGEGVHCADGYEQALRLRRAIGALRTAAGARALIVGGGFTGIELACELAGSDPPLQVELLERSDQIAPAFGPSARAVIEEALRSLGVRTHTGVSVSAADAGGVTLADGGRLHAELVIWAGGPCASALGRQLGVPLDRAGRVLVDRHLGAGLDGVWAAGDAAAATVTGSQPALMSCQHAMPQGRLAGANAATALLGRPPRAYRQPLYLTCLDLGRAGALLTAGFERDAILARGRSGKRFKRFINRSLIYPPAGAGAAAMLKLGGSRDGGAFSAAIQRIALRSGAVRHVVTARGEDRAARHETAASP